MCGVWWRGHRIQNYTSKVWVVSALGDSEPALPSTRRSWTVKTFRGGLTYSPPARSHRIWLRKEKAGRGFVFLRSAEHRGRKTPTSAKS